MSQVPKLYHFEPEINIFRDFFLLCFEFQTFIHLFNTQVQGVKTPRGKQNTQKQVSIASTTAQHPKNVLFPDFLHYAILCNQMIKTIIIMRNVSRLFY